MLNSFNHVNKQSTIAALLEVRPLPRPIKLPLQKWPPGTSPLVSICCNCYNHKEYVEQCIEGFLQQKTTFPVEIIIWDDCSTDGSQQIIKEYAKKYPDLITAFLQASNLFSKKLGKSMKAYPLEKAKGAFFALCDADDYWISPEKLEKQIAAMTKYDVGISGHPAVVLSSNGERLGKMAGYSVTKTKKFKSRSLFFNKCNMLPMASIVLDQAAKDAVLLNQPPIRFHSGLQAIASKRNGLVVLDGIFSAYRTDVPGSATFRLLGDSQKRNTTALRRIESLRLLRSLYAPKCRFPINFCIASQYPYLTEEKRVLRRVQVLLGNEHLIDRAMVLICLIFLKVKMRSCGLLQRLTAGPRRLLRCFEK